MTVSELIGETELELSPELKNLVESAKHLSSEQIELIINIIKNMK